MKTWTNQWNDPFIIHPEVWGNLKFKSITFKINHYWVHSTSRICKCYQINNKNCLNDWSSIFIIGHWSPEATRMISQQDHPSTNGYRAFTWFPLTSEITLKNIGKITHCRTTTKHNNAWTMCIFHGVYCSFRDHFVNAPSQWAQPIRDDITL